MKQNDTELIKNKSIFYYIYGVL